jgi:four helix bundle suffix protein
MVYIARQMESMALGGVQRHGYRPKGKRKRQLFILQGLPGVGPGRAARLLARFGSVEAAVCANSSELQTVDGIGEGIADKIKWAVSERVSPYKTYRTYIEGTLPDVAANTLICLVHQTNYLLDQQLRQLEKQFLKQGGFTEKLYRARKTARRF